jgi:hypothetical protein
MNTEDKEFDLKWICNEPKDCNKSWNEYLGSASPIFMSLQDYKNWRKQFIEGEPQAKSAATLQQLKAMGYIGLYKKVAKEA